MIHYIYILISLLLFASPYSYARITVNEYIEVYKYEAINEMLDYGIPASITLAQGILESDCGNSPLALNARNHFGIKCHVEWTGPTYIQDDDKKDECFRVYNDVRESYRDHSLFLKDRPRYASLFSFEITDYKAWAYGLKKAGYATNPVYAEKLIKIIEENELHKLDHVKNIKAVKNLVLKEKKNDITNSESFTSNLVTSVQQKHSIKINNHINYIIAQNGDTYYSIAKEYDIDIRLLYRYNDLPETENLSIGQYIYLKPKRNKGEGTFHTVQAGESMYSISQLYGIKLKKLYKKNNLPFNSEPKVGDILSLQKKLKK